MTGNEYQVAAMRTARVGGDHLTEGLMGLCGESGECIDILKKSTFQGHTLDRLHLAEELGDVAWYLAVSAAALGFDLDEIFRMNINKLKKRYPDGFDAERSVNRSGVDLEEQYYEEE